jgi:hypothetical protein
VESSKVIAEIALHIDSASSSDFWWMFLPVALPLQPDMWI